jgi:hypothetical protein
MPILAFLAALALICAPAVEAQQRADRRDASQIADSLAIVSLARQLTAAVQGDSARAAALYEWVARNVEWDVRAYLDGASIRETAEDVFRRRIALCGGYVALYARLAREAGLVVEPIEGYAKGFDYVHGQSTSDPNHAWLALRLHGGWRLVDPTWGSGHVADGRFVPHFSWSYFLVPAEELILSHFPEKSQWQLVSQPLRRREFERMPAVPRELFRLGFTPAAVRAAALARGTRDFPAIGRQEDAVQVLQAPVVGTLPSNTLVELDLIWPGATDVVLVSGDVWTPLSRSGDRFRGAAPAGAAGVYVVGRTVAEASYSTLLHYRVQ